MKHKSCAQKSKERGNNMNCKCQSKVGVKWKEAAKWQRKQREVIKLPATAMDFVVHKQNEQKVGRWSVKTFWIQLKDDRSKKKKGEKIITNVKKESKNGSRKE